MKFRIEKDSPIPVGTQIKERIRIGLTLGELKAGDVLPSIRDFELETGTGRAIIRKAYLDLQKQGILEIRHGRRVSISDSVTARAHDKGLRERLEKFTQETLRKAAEHQLNEVSFARYLLSRAIEQVRESNQLIYADRSKRVALATAATISGFWDLPVGAASFHELPDLLRNHSDCPQKIITSYYRLDEVLKLVKKHGRERSIEVIPTAWAMSEDMKSRILKLPTGSKVLLVAEKDDWERNGQTFADLYEREFPGLSFAVAPMKSHQTLEAAVASQKYALIIPSNAIWDQLPESYIRNRKLMNPAFEITKPALEEARTKVGILQ
jgi:DNA-binding transcriptional regulator YhcF (GntR family)